MSIERLPTDYRRTLIVVALTLGATAAGATAVRAIAQEATDARMREKWAAELRTEATKAAKEAATEAATKAASEAARAAVREVVGEVVRDIEVHKARQEEREQAVNERLRALENGRHNR